MAAVDDDSKKMITLKSSDGEEFEVEEAVAMGWQIIRHMIEDDSADNRIPLPNVNSKILSKVIVYCSKHVQAVKPAGAAEGGAAATPAADGSSAAPAPTEDLKNCDAEFIKVDQATLFDLRLPFLALDLFCPAARIDIIFAQSGRSPILVVRRLFLGVFLLQIDWALTRFYSIR
jgi:hypothetical protein